MRRTLIAVTWIAGTTVPLLMAVTFIFGCCVLPFHRFIHRAMPFCSMAAGMLAGEHHQPASLPSHEKQQPAKRIASELPAGARTTVTVLVSALRLRQWNAASHRSFISLGATRCDQDVGLHLIIVTLLI
jgi:hypothetical protein